MFSPSYIYPLLRDRGLSALLSADHNLASRFRYKSLLIKRQAELISKFSFDSVPRAKHPRLSNCAKQDHLQRNSRIGAFEPPLPSEIIYVLLLF